MTPYEELFSEMNRRAVRYLVAGGVAIVLHGFLRATGDLDLYVDLESENVARMLAMLRELGYRPKPPVPLEDFALAEKRRQWKDEKGMLVFSVFHPKRSEELIDIFVEQPIPFPEAYKRRALIPAYETNISVMSEADLIQLKQKAARPQDLEDIKALQEIIRRKTSS